MTPAPSRSAGDQMTETHSKAPRPRRAPAIALTRYEQNAMARFRDWFAAAQAAPDPAGAARPAPAVDEANPRLLLLCMTPRSGSTALSAALAASRRLGLGGERLNRNTRFMTDIIAAERPETPRALLERVIAGARTPNGVAQIKCDLPQVLPFLLDPACFAILRNAALVYLTREDVLAQAISRYRGFQAGVWHAGKEGAGKEAEPAGKAAEAPYDFHGISDQLAFIANMMQGYERLFGALGLKPLRITYEGMTADTPGTLARIAALLGESLPPDLDLAAGGFAPVSGRNNSDLRDRFLTDARAFLLKGG